MIDELFVASGTFCSISPLCLLDVGSCYVMRYPQLATAGFGAGAVGYFCL